MEAQKLNSLIKRYIDGTATTTEREELLQWYRSRGNEEMPSPYRNLKEEFTAKDKMLGDLLTKIGRQPVIKTHNRKPLRYGIAASILVIVAAGMLIMQKQAFFKTENSVANSIIKTGHGERKKIVLTDGSVIWLSAESSMSYPTAFVGTTREITFAGEAFFDIAHDKTHPFIVHTGKTAVRVLGTTFNINAYPAQRAISVSLLTGKVSFTAGTAQQQLLPGKRVVYANATGEIQVEDIGDTETVKNRRNGLYEYNNVSVEEIVEDLNRNFDIKVTMEGPVKDCLFYGRIKPGESPDKFLYKLGKVVDAAITKHNNTYTIKEKYL
jgi:transmembrane sensor